MVTYYLLSLELFINVKCWLDNLISIKGMALSITQKHFVYQKGKNKRDVIRKS